MNHSGSYPQAPAAPAYAPATGAAQSRPLGKIRGPGAVFLLIFFTFGLYAAYYYYCTFDELHRWRGQGWSGGIYLLYFFLCGVPCLAIPWLLPSYVGALYREDGQSPTVSGLTGFWIFIPFLGGIIWIYRVQGALNNFWRGKGAQG